MTSSRFMIFSIKYSVSRASRTVEFKTPALKRSIALVLNACFGFNFVSVGVPSQRILKLKRISKEFKTPALKRSIDYVFFCSAFRPYFIKPRNV